MNPKRKKSRRRNYDDPRVFALKSKPVLCRALIVVDASALRRKVISDCRRARTTFEKAELELRQYEMEDKPAFVRWHRSELGPLIGELEQLARKINAMRLRLDQIDRFAALKPCTHRRAVHLYEKEPAEFARMLEEMEEKIRRQEEELRARQEENRRRLMARLLGDFGEYLSQNKRPIQTALRQGYDPEQVVSDLVYGFCSLHNVVPWEVYEVLNRLDGKVLLDGYGLGWDEEEGEEDAADLEQDEVLEEMFEGFRSGGRSSGRGKRLEEKLAAPSGKADDARLKSLYRELAFALHPDQSETGADPAKLALWHQVQEAMAHRDLDLLEVLHAHMMILRGGLSDGMPVSSLMGLTRMYRSSRDALRRTIRGLRRNIEWDFMKMSESLREEMKQRLVHDLLDQREEGLKILEDLEREYRGITRPPSRVPW